MRCLIVFVGLVVIAHAYTRADLEDWAAFKAKFGKHYSAEEDADRLARFLATKQTIETHNQKYEQGKSSFKQGLNPHSDWFVDELKHLNGVKKPTGRYGTNGAETYTYGGQEPEAIDWRDYGAVSSVKNQGQCAVCWSFVASGVLEAQLQRKTGQMIELSQQNLVDCIQQGICQGNWIDVAFEYAKNGICALADYPFLGDRGVGSQCKADWFSSYASVSRYLDIPWGDEQLLKNAVGLYGPVGVAIDTSLPSFDNYQGGIYQEDRCSTNNPVHAVLVVGYGSENGVDYWLIKNSWDTFWGENGYIRMRRNYNNMCGIASYASFALLN